MTTMFLDTSLMLDASMGKLLKRSFKQNLAGMKYYSSAESELLAKNRIKEVISSFDKGEMEEYFRNYLLMFWAATLLRARMNKLTDRINESIGSASSSQFYTCLRKMYERHERE